jgi:bidirectional [NiFe] hydrogenase diaphorase subunit
MTLATPATSAPEAPATLTLTVDGQLCAARPGAMLLEVVRERGIYLPTLCEMTGLSSVGACRLCLVEVAGRSRPVAACVTAAEEGMEISTDTERLRHYRRTTLQLLFAERNHVCSVCVANGHCELQDLAAANGVDHVDFDYLHPSDLRVDASHARFAIDHNRCVLCTRCVRACSEVEGAHTWDVAGRGRLARVITDMAMPWGDSITCTSCGKCVNSCPTGALFLKGSGISEMVKDRGRLRLLSTARREGVWNLAIVDRREVNP